jgi:hypothetical protein
VNNLRLGRSWPLTVPQPYSRASAILVDEFDAGLPQDSLYHFERFLVAGITPYLDVCDGIAV